MRVEAPVKVTWRDTNLKGKGLDDVELSGITFGLDSVREDNIKGFSEGIWLCMSIGRRNIRRSNITEFSTIPPAFPRPLVSP